MAPRTSPAAGNPGVDGPRADTFSRLLEALAAEYFDLAAAHQKLVEQVDADTSSEVPPERGCFDACFPHNATDPPPPLPQFDDSDQGSPRQPRQQAETRWTDQSGIEEKAREVFHRDDQGPSGSTPSGAADFRGRAKVPGSCRSGIEWESKKSSEGLKKMPSQFSLSKKSFTKVQQQGSMIKVRKAATSSGIIRNVPPLQSKEALANQESNGGVTASTHAVVLELWPSWRDRGQEGNLNFTVSSKTCLTSLTGFAADGHKMRGGDTMREKNSVLQNLVIGPNSGLRTFWDLLSVFVLGYDVLMVPTIFLNQGDSDLKKVLDFSTTLFWTCDILFTFLSGFHVGGVVEMRPRRIAHNYFKHWFLPDVVVVGMDWIMYLMSAVNIVGIIRMVKILRASRLFRLFRLLRLMKLPSWADNLYDCLQSEALATGFGIFRSLLVIAVVNHFIACSWYGVGEFCHDQLHLPAWVEIFDEEEYELGIPRDMTYRYFTSIHWSLTQFTPASMEVMPRNTYERMFAIIVLFSALVTFSSFVSSITTAMTNLRRVNMEKSKQAAYIRRYISENRVSLDLGNRIQAFIRSNKFMSKRRVHEEDIPVFKVLPEVLRLQLHLEVYMPIMVEHPLFHHINVHEETVMVNLCHEAMTEMSLTIGQDLFQPAQLSNHMYFTLSGVWEYYHGWTDHNPEEVDRHDKGPWLCEVTLWLKWEHYGRIVALTMCECVALDAAKFRRLIARHPIMWSACTIYAHEFEKRMQDACLTDNLDVWQSFDDAQEMAHTAFAEYVVPEGGESSTPGSLRTVQLQKNFIEKVWRTWTGALFNRNNSGDRMTHMETCISIRSNTM